MAGSEVLEIVDGGQLSRLLYVNPVCVLSVASVETNRFNCLESEETPGRRFNYMTITWITCINNKVLRSGQTRSNGPVLNQTVFIQVIFYQLHSGHSCRRLTLRAHSFAP